MTDDGAMTPLEEDLFGRYHARYAEAGFPVPTSIRVVSRENTGAGRYTYVDHDGSVEVEDGDLGLGTYSTFLSTCLPAGASFWVYVKAHRIIHLDIAVNGHHAWDGDEGEWAVCDPDTGELERPIEELPYEGVELPRRSWWHRLLDRMFGL